MAIVKDPLFQGFSGKFGDQFVFRQIGGKTHRCKLPAKKKCKKPRTLLEALRQRKFRDSCYYAKEAIHDTALRPIYESMAGEGRSAYNMAMADAQKPPTLSDLKAKGYRGIPGNTIDVRAEDNICVAKVSFTIYSADGAEIETGEAIPYRYAWRWRYTVRSVNSKIKGSIIRVVAEDLPGNQVVLEHTI